MTPKLKPSGTKRFKLQCDIMLPTSAFKFNLRRYTSVAAAWTLEERRGGAGAGEGAEASGHGAGGGGGGGGEITFSMTSGELPPLGEVEVECFLAPSEPGPYRSIIVCTAGRGLHSFT
jgi:hypothetical protein